MSEEGKQESYAEVTGKSMRLEVASVPKLNGKNFQTWKNVLYRFIKLRKLEVVLTGKDSDNTRELEVQVLLIQTMDEQHQARVSACKTSKEIMDRLSQQYADESESNLYTMLSDLQIQETAGRPSCSPHRKDGSKKNSVGRDRRNPIRSPILYNTNKLLT